MTTRIGINGFGRIGRQSLKAIIERAPDVEVVAVNDLVDTEMNALLFKHDSTYGAYPGDGRAHGRRADRRRPRDQGPEEKDPAALPWGDLGVDIVLESTGMFTDADKARAHIDARRQEGDHQRARQGRGRHDRARRERGQYDPAKHDIISNASCTTNCLAPAAKVVHDPSASSAA